MQHFISYEEFKIIFSKQFEGEPAESSFLKLKYDVSSNYGPINKNEKSPPILNKKVPTWIFQTPLELFEKTRRGQKNYRYILRQHKIKGHNTQWGKALNDNTISNIEVNKKLNWLRNLELSQDIVDRQQRLLY